MGSSAHYTERLNDVDIVQLLNDGTYTVDLATAEVRTRSGDLLKHRHKKGRGDEKRPCVRLFSSPKSREISVSILVWIAGTRSVVPEGFEIHHMDENWRNNAFVNLLCVHGVDHDKLHGKSWDRNGVF